MDSDIDVSVVVIAKMLNLTERRIQQLTKQGIFDKSGRGKYNLLHVASKYIRYLQEKDSEERSDLQTEKTRLTRHQANNEALKEAINRRELIPAPDIIEAWSEMVGAMRARLLALPGRLANRVMSFDTVRDAEDYAREEVYSALQELGDAGTGKAKDEA